IDDGKRFLSMQTGPSIAALVHSARKPSSRKPSRPAVQTWISRILSRFREVCRDLSCEVASHLTDFNDLTIGIPVAPVEGSEGGSREMSRAVFATVVKVDAMILIYVHYDAVE